jgi:hypothetical protein
MNLLIKGFGNPVRYDKTRYLGTSTSGVTTHEGPSKFRVLALWKFCTATGLL